MLTPFDLAKLCQLDYDEELGSLGCARAERHQWRTQMATVLRRDGERGAVVVFRGTSVREWGDVLADVRTLRRYNGLLGWHHRGFGEAATGLWVSSLAGALQPLADAPLLLTGHSLGGAVALLTARLLPDKYRDVRVVTFGAPRAGFWGLGRYLRARCGRLELYAHAGDPVPHVPTCLLGWRHPVRPAAVGSAALVPFHNHRVACYVAALKAKHE